MTAVRLNITPGLQKQTERNIEVTGSASFDIVSDKNRPFVVKANVAGIRVLGTIFNVNVHRDRVMCENIDGQVKLYEWKILIIT